MFLQTEFEFKLPKGYVDENGGIHRVGIMRIATAGDEINAMKDPRAKNNPEYLNILVLSKVIIKLENLPQITPEVIEKMYKTDYQFLQNMYQTINSGDEPLIHVTCPYCGKSFSETINFIDDDR